MNRRKLKVGDRVHVGFWLSSRRYGTIKKEEHGFYSVDWDDGKHGAYRNYELTPSETCYAVPGSGMPNFVSHCTLSPGHLGPHNSGTGIDFEWVETVVSSYPAHPDAWLELTDSRKEELTKLVTALRRIK